ncbi:MAG: methyltransferase domain-containing protein [Anaerolineae bacterium]|nr:methyltransferase domain-containing protein [Anaerolineae bacterium]
MVKLIYTLLGLIITLIIASLWWRWASRRQQLPCPAWLAWFLDNPVIEVIAGTQATLDRIGLRSGEYGLDVGCGPGRLSIPAARRVGPAGTVVALDIQPEMLAHLHRKIEQAGITNIVTHLSDITTDDNLLPNSFDRAWLVTVLGEIPDRLAALQNLYRILKPGGTLSITEILGDPHYQTRSTVLGLGKTAGFEPAQYWGTFLAFTQNFTKV